MSKSTQVTGNKRSNPIANNAEENEDSALSDPATAPPAKRRKTSANNNSNNLNSSNSSSNSSNSSSSGKNSNDNETESKSEDFSAWDKPTPLLSDKLNDFNTECMKRRVSEAAKSPLVYDFDETRIRPVSELNPSSSGGTHGKVKKEDISNIKGVVYWMSRDQRVQDNWALVYAQKLALEAKKPLYVVFCLLPKFLDATIRHFDFMLKGLEEVEAECRELNIPFYLLLGRCTDVLPKFVQEKDANVVVCDFSPMRIAKQWVKDIAATLSANKVHLAQVDAHNVVPLWVTSDKQEYAARTIRNKINSKLGKYLTEFPPIVKHEFGASDESKNNNNNSSSSSSSGNGAAVMETHPKVDWAAARAQLEVNMDIKPVAWATPGTQGAYSNLLEFLSRKLKTYNTDRNNPNMPALSNVSPWLHFGHISAQRVALEVSRNHQISSESVKSYLEELIVRRELSDNFCFFNENYDNIKCAFGWAAQTLKDHKGDKREYIYTQKQFETYKTHDILWNAAQKQLVATGKMHGFLRMYWAKKILEWTKTPEDAIKIAIYLNDAYSLDGRDPNGYVGVMWSICGIHDQGWRERPVFGKIRFMNFKGCQRKFDVNKFASYWKVSNGNDISKFFSKKGKKGGKAKAVKKGSKEKK